MLTRAKVLLASLLLSIAVATPQFAAAMSVSLTPSISSPAAVGTIVTWNTVVSDAAPGTLWYRFGTRAAGADFNLVRDYGPASTLNWTASEHEGTYEIEVSVRNTETGESAVNSLAYRFVPVVRDLPVISPTANSLVFLYSAPACPAGGLMRVDFQTADGVMTHTPYKDCADGLTMNFYLAGIRANSFCLVQHVVVNGSRMETGPLLALTTAQLMDPMPGNPLPIPQFTVLRSPQLPTSNGILLQATLINSTVATDLYGNLLWYYPGQISFLTRPQLGGTFFGIFEAFGSDPSYSYLREFDLAGTTIRETNAARINEQLAALGKRQITAFHHEARGLPDGGVLVLAAAEQMMTDIQGPGQVDVLGDVILALDNDLQLVWSWDSFEHLNWYRMATLGETCTPTTGGCPPFYQAPQANDWLHGNSVQRTPDGNILYSARHQDWVIKIDYSDGHGNGDIIWRLGKDGDFQISSADPNPWFSHQHDPQFEPGNDAVITLFDNGNVRRAADSNANSRGQVLLLDEQHHVATFILNADLGAYSFALGSAQHLPNSNFHFNLGWVGNGTSQSVEVDRLGNIVCDLQIGSPDYRSFRMKDLYTPFEDQAVEPIPPRFKARLGRIN
jgi:arylsulfate sulfotransferase